MNASRTMPQGIHMVGWAQIADPDFGTPRNGWEQEPEEGLITQEFRLLAETSLQDADVLSEAVLSALTSADTYLSIMPLNPLGMGCTGAGYRSSYRIEPNQSWSFPMRTLGLSTGSQLLSQHSTFLLAGCADAWKTSLPDILLRYFEAGLWSKWREPIVAMHERTLAETVVSKMSTLPELALEDETSNETAFLDIERETHVGALRWLEEHACLSQGAIADLVGVSRQTVQNWLKGESIRDENRQRLLAVREILERVQRRHDDEDALKTWLDTPSGVDGRTPRQLLLNNEIRKARALSVSTAPPQARTTPTWLRESPPDQWTLRQRRRRDHIVPEQAELEFESDED